MQEKRKKGKGSVIKQFALNPSLKTGIVTERGNILQQENIFSSSFPTLYFSATKSLLQFDSCFCLIQKIKIHSNTEFCSVL